MQGAPMRAALFNVRGPHFAHGQRGHLVGFHFGSGGGFLVNDGGLSVALKLARVGAGVNRHAQAVCLSAGGINAPGANVPDSAADGLPV